MKTREEIQERVDELLAEAETGRLVPGEIFELNTLDWVLGE